MGWLWGVDNLLFGTREVILRVGTGRVTFESPLEIQHCPLELSLVCERGAAGDVGVEAECVLLQSLVVILDGLFVVVVFGLLNSCKHAYNVLKRGEIQLRV